ncbi:hypothetical protein AAF712_016792 [Marasmius tenuissimus]|uniref:Uncharacterized protein n=1 Tax=Marasmius tenuissimus TaxID=585030 RepID=A0ABR2Z5T3_9AGAR
MVGGRWRETALSTPSLRSSIGISFGSWTANMGALTRLLEVFMTRSKKSPLTVEVVPSGKYEPDASSVVDMLLQNCDRWEHFSLSNPAVITRGELLFPAVRGQNLFRLRSLRIQYRDRNKDDEGELSDIDDLAGVFSLCLSLRGIDLEVNFPGFMDELELPLSQITRASITAASVQNIVDFLPSCSHLRELHLINVGELPEENEHTDTWESSTLQHISCALQSQDDIDSLFPRLTNPSVEFLSLSSLPQFSSRAVLNAWPLWPGLSIMDYISCSNCSITTLHLKRLPITAQQTTAVLQLMPNLASLQIEELARPASHSNRIVTNEFLQQFVVDQESHWFGHTRSPFLPHLTDLYLKVHGTVTFERDSFALVSS